MTIRTCAIYGVVAATIFVRGSVAHGEFIPVAGFNQHLFPSYLIATANIRADSSVVDPHRLGDPSGILGIEVVSPGKDVAIQVTIECDEYFEQSTYTGRLREAQATYRITPKVKYRYDRLAERMQAAPTNVTFRVRIGQGPEEEQTVTCTMRSIHDCAYSFHDGDEVVNVNYSFAAYVNEQHPFVDKLLREALDRGVVTSFRGYQSGKPEDVVRQAYAVWDLLCARDVRYSNITATVADNDSVGCQHIRLIENSVNNSQANCVDGSVLWVSILRKIGIDAFLVMTADHCYAGFYLNAKHDGVLAIETTLLSTENDFDSATTTELLKKAVSEDDRYDETFSSFVAAVEMGTKAYNDAEKQDSNQNRDDFQVIDIAKMRKAGVLPIPFRGNEEFIAHDFTSSEDEDEEDE